MSRGITRYKHRDRAFIHHNPIKHFDAIFIFPWERKSYIAQPSSRQCSNLL